MEPLGHRRFALFLILTIFVVWFSGFIQREIKVFDPTKSDKHIDFAVYYTAGLVASSQSDRRLYSLTKDGQADDRGTGPKGNPQLMPPDPLSTYAGFDNISRSSLQYLYPPPFAVLMIPVTYLPYNTASMVWHFALTLFLFCGIFFTFSIFVSRNSERFILAALAVAFFEFTLPMQDLLMVGNVGSLMLLLCAFCSATLKRSPLFSAFALALATSIKLTPIVVLPVMLIGRQWKWCITYSTSLVLLLLGSISVVGLENHYEFFLKIVPGMSQGVPVSTNASFSSVIYSLLSGISLSTADYPEKVDGSFFGYATIVFKILAFATYSSVLIVVARKRQFTEIGSVVAVITSLLWTLPFSPVSWRHAYVLAFLPIICAWMLAYREKWDTVRTMILAVGSILLLSILPQYAAAATDSFILDLIATVSLPFGALLLMVLLLESYRKIQTGENDAHNVRRDGQC
ncbi:MAG: DUF2029 domain-containing protein [Acidobacteria bacterium]|nr:DUF2029 domain-containing protein [Acidobacteriota bacterium]